MLFRSKDINIQGEEYQQGNLYNYSTIKSYLLAREKGKCQLCNKIKEADKWHIHHLKEKKNCGTNQVDNLVLLHKKCHEKLHQDNIKLKIKTNKEYKDAAFMNTINNKFQQDLNCEITYGVDTYLKRNELGLEKSHYNDAFVIASGSNQIRGNYYHIFQHRKNNRCLQINRKGYRPSIRRKRYDLKPHDLVKINNKIHNVVGIHGLGKYIILKDTFYNKFNVNIKKLDVWKFNFNSLIWEI